MATVGQARAIGPRCQTGPRPHCRSPLLGRKASTLSPLGLGRRLDFLETALIRAALDLTIIGPLADGGLRRSETVALTWADVELWATAPAVSPSRTTSTTPNRQRWRGPRPLLVPPGKFSPSMPTPQVRCSVSPARPWPTGCSPRCGPPAWATDSADASAWPARWRGRSPNVVAQRQGQWKHGETVIRYSRGETA